MKTTIIRLTVTIFFSVPFLLFSIVSNGFSYKYDCSLSSDSVCGNNNILCQIQYYVCCPVNGVKREQDCTECQGYWYNSGCHLAPAGNVVLGDVTGDGNVNIVDALFVARHAVGLPVSNFNTDAADVNCDGQINIVDALFIARKAVGLSVNGWCGD